MKRRSSYLGLSRTLYFSSLLTRTEYLPLLLTSRALLICAEARFPDVWAEDETVLELNR